MNPIPNQQASVGVLFDYAFPTDTFVDFNGDPLTYIAKLDDGTVLPSDGFWIQFNPSLRRFSGIPSINDKGIYQLFVSADNGNGGERISTFNIDVLNQSPTLTIPIPDQSISVAKPYSYQVNPSSFSEPDGEILTYEAMRENGVSLPSWLSFDSNSLIFSGTPPEFVFESIKLTAADPYGATASEIFSINVTNSAPYVSEQVPTQEAILGIPYSYAFSSNTFTDPDAHQLYYTATNNGTSPLPLWLAFDAPTRTFSGLAELSDKGSLLIELTADDTFGGKASAHFQMQATNHPPTHSTSINDQTVIPGEELNFSLPLDTFTDPDGHPLTYSASVGGSSSLPSWLTFTSSTLTFKGTPGSNDRGDLLLVVQANDGYEGKDTLSFNLEVYNGSPNLNIPLTDQLVIIGSPFDYTFPINTFLDPEGDSLTFVALLTDNRALPGWLSFNAATRTFSGLPQDEDRGLSEIRLTAYDPFGGSASDVFTVTMPNEAPTVSNPIPDQEINVSQSYSYSIPPDSFFDVEGDLLSYSARLAGGENLPTWLNFVEEGVPTFSGIPNSGDQKIYQIELLADDGVGGIGVSPFDLTVLNRVPVVNGAISNQLVNVNQQFSLNVDSSIFFDPDGDPLNYSAARVDGNSLPNWLYFDPEALTFSGTPQNDDREVIAIQLKAEDVVSDYATASFDLRVNGSPVVEQPLSTQVVTVGEEFGLNLVEKGTFGDADGDELSYFANLSNGSPLPSWLSFIGSEGVFSGTLDSGNHETLIVKVDASDGYGGSASHTFSLNVANQLPQATLEIPTQKAGINNPFIYEVPQDLFVDPEGDPIVAYRSYSEGGVLPNWLEFQMDKFRFEGYPAESDKGIWDITLEAEDSYGGVGSTTFAISVAEFGDNRAPVRIDEIPDQFAKTDELFTFTISDNLFLDPDGDTLYYNASMSGGPLPGWLNFDEESRVFLGIPTESDLGSYPLTITASDNLGGLASDTFKLTVSDSTNYPPIVLNRIDRKLAKLHKKFEFYIPNDTFLDPEGDPLTITVNKLGSTDLPKWLSYDEDTRLLEGTPGDSDTGFYYNSKYLIEVVASDGANQESTTFSVILRGETPGKRLLAILGGSAAGLGVLAEVISYRGRLLNWNYPKTNEIVVIGKEQIRKLDIDDKDVKDITLQHTDRWYFMKCCPLPAASAICSRYFILNLAPTEEPVVGGRPWLSWDEWVDDRETVKKFLAIKNIPKSEKNKQYIIRVMGVAHRILHEIKLTVVKSNSPLLGSGTVWEEGTEPNASRRGAGNPGRAGEYQVLLHRTNDSQYGNFEMRVLTSPTGEQPDDPDSDSENSEFFGRPIRATPHSAPHRPH